MPAPNAQAALGRFERLGKTTIDCPSLGAKKDQVHFHMAVDRRQRWIKRAVERDVPTLIVFQFHVSIL